MMVPDWAGYLRFRGQFIEVLDPARYPIEWLDHMVASAAFRVWIGREAAIIARIETYPTGAMDIHGMLAAGELEEIVNELIPQAEQWAREIGCIGVRIESRSGWVRALKGAGYRLHQSMLQKAL